MNNLSELNEHLFEQLNRLQDSQLTTEQIQVESQRSNAMVGIAKAVVESGKLMIIAEKFQEDRLDANAHLPNLLDLNKSVIEHG